MSGDQADVSARATWSALVEPGDVVAGTLVGLLGAVDALDWVRAAHRHGPDLARVEDRFGALADADRRRVAKALARWAVRLPECDPGRDLERLDRLRGTLLVPGDPRWPSALDDLGTAAPFCVWVRGEPDLGAALTLSAAVVGSRAATSYGERVAFDLADGLTADGLCVVSGGAYGIDAAAHRGAVARGGRTLVVLAGGVDRAYPAGNARLLDAVVGAGGALLSEVPPGSLPTRSRFLQRNRLIAAAGRATVVVEAAWRSGAMSTAHHAARLLRPVGAVPGPVTSMASAGCHRLLREGVAVCVTDAAEVRELAGVIGSGVVAVADAASSADERAARRRDVLDPVSQRVLDALARRVPTDLDRVASLAGVTVAEARGAVGLLELDGWAARRGDGWVVLRTDEP
ncbi:DNA-processing protein DprA [Cellulomonas sp. Leaf334]|uniref:DNA-processing protein DprA n=1 Tax=Cellulomonas sp. Leaf334 TaxID=1736339 RepID=UPI0006FCC92F|nr:DNA-processing protein DprA [Cellulomonas sp. Leaf334]KQR11066.1 DNA processing protein DprA [Cellulomonas sp. Leaf334]